jgi:hypothetical protein
MDDSPLPERCTVTKIFGGYSKYISKYGTIKSTRTFWVYSTMFLCFFCIKIGVKSCAYE